MLPERDQLGQSGTWNVPGGESGDVVVDGQFVGLGSSKAEYHTLHNSDTHAPIGMKCQACRWLEIRIFDDGDLFTVSYVGRSEVPGETDRQWHMVTDGEDALVHLLSGEGRNGRFFSKPARLAIESAKEHMPTIWDAYQEHPGHR